MNHIDGRCPRCNRWLPKFETHSCELEDRIEIKVIEQMGRQRTSDPILHRLLSELPLSTHPDLAIIAATEREAMSLPAGSPIREGGYLGGLGLEPAPDGSYGRSSDLVLAWVAGALSMGLVVLLAILITR